MTPREVEGNLPRFFFITQLIKDKVIQLKADKRIELGRLTDLEIRLGRVFPEVVNLIVGRSFGRPPLEVPFSWVTSIDAHRTVVEVPPGEKLREFDQESSRILVKDMILDKKIIDTDEYEVELVYDIHLLHAEGRMLVVHVDVTKAGHAAPPSLRVAGPPDLGRGEEHRAASRGSTSSRCQPTSTASTATSSSPSPGKGSPTSTRPTSPISWKS